MQIDYTLWLAKKWFWLIVLAAIIGGAVGLGVNFLQPKMYEATTTLYVSPLNQSDYQTVLGAQQIAKAFALFVPQSDDVLKATLNAVGDHSLSSTQLSSMVTASNDLNSQFVVIKVRDSNPDRATRLASAIAEQAISQFITSQNSYQIAVVQQPQLPKSPVGLGAVTGTAIGILAGLIVIVCLILFIERTKGVVVVRPEDQIMVFDQKTGLSMLITVKNQSAGKALEHKPELKLYGEVITRPLTPSVTPMTSTIPETPIGIAFTDHSTQNGQATAKHFPETSNETHE